MKHQNMLGEESIGKLLLKYSIPAIIGMMVNALYNIVDRMFIGRIPDVGSLALTGVGITMPIMSILLAFGMLIGIGSTANISLNLGRGKRDEAEKLIGDAITLSLIVGVIITIIGLIFLMDPPRIESLEAVLQCKKAGIKPIMITGDHVITATSIAKKLAYLKKMIYV